MRNCVVHNSTVVHIEDVVPWVVAFRDDYRTANVIMPSNSDVKLSVHNSWGPPEMGFFKANSDFSLDMLNGKVGVGIIIRDHVGGVMASCSQPINVALCPAVVEATAILRGFIFVNEAGFSPV
ncbi:hypothetical protein Dsin_004903 [Dipteronia sinensis]|uniref:RNase H type-1 domain-containing protein n=1 Tax=Dipteronia sinensis TaxID=43782 RepID=A0AAE0AVE8_9ROSI|nr:hypothetical protein Dsin_004903 [Dipteronia sinensis]